MQPCHQPVRLAVPYPDGLGVTVEIGGLPILERTLKVTDLLIVGMGDSFASGEGNPDVPVRFSRERAADYGPGELSGYPPASAPGRISATRSSSARTRAGSTRPATARSTPISCAPRCSFRSRIRTAP